jgi:hypothetical protein
MHVSGESDSPIVRKKQANKGSVPLPAESVEGRGLTKENAEPTLLDRTPRRAYQLARAAGCTTNCKVRLIVIIRGRRRMR